jgi:TonB family protein
MLFLLTASVGAVAAPQGGRPPLSKDEVRDSLRSKTPSKKIVASIDHYGIDFQPTAADLEEFRKAGADKTVLAALRKGWHPAISKPLSAVEIRMLLSADALSENIARLVLERGIDFRPSESYLQEIQSEGAKDGLIATLRAAMPRPCSEAEVLQFLRTNMDQNWIAQQVEQRALDFAAGPNELEALRTAGAQAALLEVIRTAQRVKPFVPQAPPPLEISGPLVQGGTAKLTCGRSDKEVPVLVDPHDLGVVAASLPCGVQVTFLEKVVSPPGFDKIRFAEGKEGFVSNYYLETPIATPGGDVAPPSLSYHPNAQYTHEALRDRIEGTLKFWIVIDTQGKVSEIQESSAPLGDGLDKSAMDTVKTWKFAPATRGGVAVPVRVQVEVNFRLRPGTP